MKKILLYAIVCLLAFTQKTNAQAYTFSKRTETYNAISGGSALSSSIKLPFHVTIDGVKNDSLYISTYFGTISTKKKSGEFNAFVAEIQDGTRTYAITGTAGDRIIKLQFDKQKFSHLTWTSDQVTFQIWLYEKDNAIEMHMGSSTVSQPTLAYYFHSPEGPAIGLKNMWLTGTPSNPATDTSTTETYMSGTPANGQVYRFEPSTTSISNTHKNMNGFTIYPNPAKRKVHIVFDRPESSSTISITDLTGKTILEKQVNGTSSTEFNISELPAGSYIINLSNATGSSSEKLFID